MHRVNNAVTVFNGSIEIVYIFYSLLCILEGFLLSVVVCRTE